MYSLIIVDAGLELVPPSMRNHPSVKNYAKKVGRKSDEILLQTTYHYKAMIERKLQNWWKRGRPDIIHFSLLAALSTPLFMEGKLKVYVSTVQDKLIIIGNNLRLPKSYSRFEGVMMNLFRDNFIPDSANKDNLLELKDDINFEGAINEFIKPHKILGFSINGRPYSLGQVLKENIKDSSQSYCFVVGGFQRGHFTDNVTSALDGIYAISDFRLEAHVVIARIIYECEKLSQ